MYMSQLLILWWLLAFSFRRYSQPKFVLHDGIAAGVFNAAYSGATGTLGAWDRCLLNPELLDLLLKRMESDYNAVSLKSRRPFGMKELDAHLKTG